MRCQTCSIHLRIKALDQNNFLGCLVRKVVPLVVGVMLDTEGSTLSVGVDETNGHQVVLRIEMAPV